jgi:hypothetical protein
LRHGRAVTSASALGNECEDGLGARHC